MFHWIHIFVSPRCEATLKDIVGAMRLPVFPEPNAGLYISIPTSVPAPMSLSDSKAAYDKLVEKSLDMARHPIDSKLLLEFLRSGSLLRGLEKQAHVRICSVVMRNLIKLCSCKYAIEIAEFVLRGAAPEDQLHAACDLMRAVSSVASTRDGVNFLEKLFDNIDVSVRPKAIKYGCVHHNVLFLAKTLEGSVMLLRIREAGRAYQVSSGKAIARSLRSLTFGRRLALGHVAVLEALRRPLS